MKICFVLSILIVGISGTGFAQNSNKDQAEKFTDEQSKKALETLKSVEVGLQYVAQKTRPSVVTIFVKKEIKRRGFPFRFRPSDRARPKRKVRGLGSGVIIRSNGYIVTNYHVVKDVSDVQVMLNNQEKVSASIVGTDPTTDLAVLKIDRSQLPELDFANSDELRVGQWAIAVGSPFSLSNSVSFGHISALHRSIQATQYENFIQTDAPINRGNSGGPLVNIHGEIIGINTLIQSTSGGSQGIGFANASNLVRRTVRDLIEHGKVKRAWLGVAIQELPAKQLKQHFGYDHGALISHVRKGSPADKAGLQSGDLIISIEGQAIDKPAQLQRKIIQNDPGQKVTITVARKEGTKAIQVKLGERPTSKPNESNRTSAEKGILTELGVDLSRLSPKQAQQFGLSVDHPLPIVERIKPGSIAHGAGIRPRDIILSVNRDSIRSVEDFKKKLQSVKNSGADAVLLLIQRGDTRLYVSLPLPANSGE